MQPSLIAAVVVIVLQKAAENRKQAYRRDNRSAVCLSVSLYLSYSQSSSKADGRIELVFNSEASFDLFYVMLRENSGISVNKITYL